MFAEKLFASLLISKSRGFHPFFLLFFLSLFSSVHSRLFDSTNGLALETAHLCADELNGENRTADKSVAAL